MTRFCLVESKNNLGTGVPCDIFIIYLCKFVKCYCIYRLYVLYLYQLMTRSTSEDDTDQLDCTGLTHIPISPRNQSHRRPLDLQLSLGSLEELVENLLS